jgi:hypothetical protein
MTLAFGDVKRLLEGFTYKPNFTMGLYPPPETFTGIAMIRALAYCPDSSLSNRVPVEAHELELFDDWRWQNPRRLITTGRYFTQKLHLIEITAAWDVPKGLTEPDFWPWLHARITEFENHERDEFFKVNGAAVYNPHRDDYKTRIKAVKHHADYIDQRRKAGVL